MKTDFRRALARLVPVFMPEMVFYLTPSDEPLFGDFSAQIQKTEFQPGKAFGTGTKKPIDYFVELAEGLIDLPRNLDIITVQDLAQSRAFRFHIKQYLTRRARDWADLGYAESLTGFPELNSRSKFWGDDQRAALRNWEEVDDIRNQFGRRQGINERQMLRELLRRVDMMVIIENRLDCLVRLYTPFPPGKIGGAEYPGMMGAPRYESAFGPNGSLSEILIPAGYVTEVYDYKFALSEDLLSYEMRSSDTPTPVPAPGMPFSLVFRAEPGKEDTLLEVASTYEQATRRRIMPPQFGPIPMQTH